MLNRFPPPNPQNRVTPAQPAATVRCATPGPSRGEQAIVPPIKCPFTHAVLIAGDERTLADKSKPVALTIDGSALTIMSTSLKLEEFCMLTATCILLPNSPVTTTGTGGQSVEEADAMQTVPTGVPIWALGEGTIRGNSRKSARSTMRYRKENPLCSRMEPIAPHQPRADLALSPGVVTVRTEKRAR